MIKYKKIFRIKIETEKSGRKLYTAQVCSELLSFRFSFRLKWVNITADGYTWSYDCQFSSIEIAESAISTYIKKNKEEDDKTIIHIEYKYL